MAHLDIDKKTARVIINTVGSEGIPPEYGFQYFTAGLDPYISILRDEYLRSFIKEGGSSFKLVVGAYGGGKTHFLYNVRELAWKEKYVVAYVTLTPEESPFHRLDLVYKAIIKGITLPLTPDELLSGYEKGVHAFLRSWFALRYMEADKKGVSEHQLQRSLIEELDRIRITESVSFSKAVKWAFRSLLSDREEDFEYICQWINGEGYDRRIHGKFGILQRIDKTTAFTMIRSLVQWVRELGYSGLVILFDEAERVPSLSTRQRELHLNNLRELIDECGQTHFKNVMIFYAVPDENFLEGRTQIYEALKQRLATVFDEINPTGVKIELEKLPIEPVALLKEIGKRLQMIYEISYDYQFDNSIVDEWISTIAKAAYNQRFGDIGYKRLFVQKVIAGFNFIQKKGYPPSKEDFHI